MIRNTLAVSTSAYWYVPLVTTNAAKVLGLERYGLEPGCDASFVMLQARDPVEAIRLRATRLKVYRQGKLLAQTPAATAALQWPGRPAQTDWIARSG